MTNTSEKRIYRIRRHHRVRAKISGTAQRPRVAVFKSNRHIFAQAIDDVSGKTLVGAGDFTMKKAEGVAKEIKGAKEKRAYSAGDHLGQALKKLGITEALFDTGGFRYHGRVKALADGLRNAGIKV
jgi:large subunit ribosomal protein L18